MAAVSSEEATPPWTGLSQVSTLHAVGYIVERWAYESEATGLEDIIVEGAFCAATRVSANLI